MTREEAIAQLKMDRDLCNFNPMTGEEEPIDEDCRKSAEALEMAIKALEQEPVLDKIRAEIEDIDLLAEYTRGDIKRMALAILDKYKAESEGI
jgi:hypothetical protein